MDFFATPKKILVDSVGHHPVFAVVTDRTNARLGIGAIYLFYILMFVILGISAFYHDSAAALLIDGRLTAAAQEERFSRVKHDAGYPAHAVDYVLREAGLSGNHIDEVVFYEKPFIKFERLLETYHAFAPKGSVSFAKAIPVWIKEKLFLKSNLKKALSRQGVCAPLRFSEHHLSHAASAFFPSPFDVAAILTIDGVGE